MPGHAKITISKNGPYLVSGDVPLAVQQIESNAAGESINWKEGKRWPAAAKYALCRCGESKTKPFCDGTHTKIGFNGKETAAHRPIMEEATILDGPMMELADAEELCAFGRFCDPHGQVWNQVEGVDKPAKRTQFVHQVGMCHSGRLMAIDKESGKVIEPELPVSIGVVEDPVVGCSGPLWVRGGITIEDSHGVAYEVRNRVTLCRCGRSENKPFCNGAHAADPKFHDGVGA